MVWADTPIPLISETGLASRPDIPKGHPIYEYATTMAAIHNLLIRGFNASYNQALSIQPGTKDAEDFLIFNQIIYEQIHHHHEAEEVVFFPAIANLAGTENIMENNVQQHKDFEQGLEDYRTYCFAATKDTYDGEKLRALMDSFVEPLGSHLRDEIPSFFALKDLDQKQLWKIWHAAEAHAQNSGEMKRSAPMALGCADYSFLIDGQKKIFPAVPFFLPYVVKYFLEGKYAGAWRFLPCTTFSERRPLAFGGDA